MRPYEIDLRVCSNFNRMNQLPKWSRFFGTVSRLGDGIFWYVVMAAMPVLYGMQGVTYLIIMALTGLSCTVVYKALKHSTARLRPCDRAELWVTVAPLDQFSFPSGHTLHAVCFTILAVAYAPLLGLVLIPFTVCVMLSRLVLGLHYPSDVLAGAVIGSVLASVALQITA